MKKNVFKLALILLISWIPSYSVFAQKQNNAWLNNYAATSFIDSQKKKIQADSFALANNIPIRQELADGTIIEIQFIDDYGMPQYFITDNAGASQTSRANTLYSGGGLGLNVTGNG